MTNLEFGEFLRDTLGPDVKFETGKDIIDAGKRLIKVNKLLKSILPILENYQKDLEYWRAGDDLDSINHITCGTPEFKTHDQLESYFNTVKKIIDQVKDGK